MIGGGATGATGDGLRCSASRRCDGRWPPVGRGRNCWPERRTRACPACRDAAAGPCRDARAATAADAVRRAWRGVCRPTGGRTDTSGCRRRPAGRRVAAGVTGRRGRRAAAAAAGTTVRRGTSGGAVGGAWPGSSTRSRMLGGTKRPAWRGGAGGAGVGAAAAGAPPGAVGPRLRRRGDRGGRRFDFGDGAGAGGGGSGAASTGAGSGALRRARRRAARGFRDRRPAPRGARARGPRGRGGVGRLAVGCASARLHQRRLLDQARRAQRRDGRLGRLGGARRSCGAAAGLALDGLGRRLREDVALGQLDVALLGLALDELPRHDLLERARRALQLDAVVLLEQVQHLLAGACSASSATL